MSHNVSIRLNYLKYIVIKKVAVTRTLNEHVNQKFTFESTYFLVSISAITTIILEYNIAYIRILQTLKF